MGKSCWETVIRQSDKGESVQVPNGTGCAEDVTEQ